MVKKKGFFGFSVFSLFLDGFLISGPYFGPKVSKRCELEWFFKARPKKKMTKHRKNLKNIYFFTITN